MMLISQHKQKKYFACLNQWTKISWNSVGCTSTSQSHNKEQKTKQNNKKTDEILQEKLKKRFRADINKLGKTEVKMLAITV